MSTDHLERQQLGMSVAGSHQLVHAIRMTLEADPEEVCLKMDFHNAHTSVSRRAVGDSLLAALTLRHLAWPPACVLVSATALDSGLPRPKVSRVWRLMASCGPWEQPNGEPRGTPRQVSTSIWASRMTWKVLDNRLAAQGGMARFVHDDGYALGRPDAPEAL